MSGKVAKINQRRQRRLNRRYREEP
jgi:hypothetical protein